MSSEISPQIETKTSATTKRNVVLTGFGLFRDHQLNPSWEAIKDDRLHIDRPNVNLIKLQVDVSYDEVDRVVEHLWETYNPLLTVHIGLAAHETAIRVESRARHGPYINDDVKQQAPHKDLRVYPETGGGSPTNQTCRREYTCKPCNFDFDRTCFDVDKLCEKMNQVSEEHKLSLKFKKSEDAGLYVCEYIFRKSLSICNRAIFLHVPDTKNFQLEDITCALKYAIEILIDEAFSCCL